ncbi:hypothetical protein [Nocardia brasiliensis]|uniref:hypothetical protein n=1 Tax=Nocardia brasiliensis TaxID=37326 RepID=UPI00366E0CCF
MLIRQRGEVVSDIQQDRHRRHHLAAVRKVFGVATADVRVASLRAALDAGSVGPSLYADASGRSARGSRVMS